MNLQILRQNLCEFGLNPNEWVIRERRSLGTVTYLEVRGRKGQAFGFLGFAERNHWITLTLEY